MIFIAACGSNSTDVDVPPPPNDTVEARTPPSQPIIDPFFGPERTLFDCTHPGVPVDRRASSPWGCVLDVDCTAPLVVGHRGAGGQYASIAPENSRAALRAALWMGVDGVEVDVRHTLDDQLVVIHDSTVDRTTDGTGTVDSMTMGEVTALHLNTVNDLGDTILGDFSCETVPTLAEVFALTKDRVFIDLDTKTDRIDLVVDAIVSAGLEDQVFVSVGDVNRAIEARALNSNIRVQIRPDTVEELAEQRALFPLRPPEIVEVPFLSLIEFILPTQEMGAALFADVWEHDIQVQFAVETVDIYLESFAKGAKIIQSEFPGAALHALDRL